MPLFDDHPDSNAPLLSVWQTNALATAGGVMAVAIVNILAMQYATLGLVLSLLVYAASLFYVLSVYPSYFSQKPKLANPEAVSFANGFFGGLIFGLLWNHNLTRKVKGSSYIFYACMLVTSVLLTLFTSAF